MVIRPQDFMGTTSKSITPSKVQKYCLFLFSWLVKRWKNVIRKKIFDNTTVYHISRIQLILASLIFTLNVWNNAIVFFNTRQQKKEREDKLGGTKNAKI